MENAEVTKEVQKEKTREIKIACPNCKKRYKASIKSVTEFVKCPHCGEEKEISVIGKYIKEPIPLQITRAIFYIGGIMSLLMITVNPILMSVQTVYCFLVPTLLKMGYSWPRLIMLIPLCVSIINGFGKNGEQWLLPTAIWTLLTIFLFSPVSSNWLFVKREIRKMKKAESKH